jgi:hypothetical protein
MFTGDAGPVAIRPSAPTTLWNQDHRCPGVLGVRLIYGDIDSLAILPKISTPTKKRGSWLASFSEAYALENGVASLCRGKR